MMPLPESRHIRHGIFDIGIPSDLLLVEEHTNVIAARFAFSAIGNLAAKCNPVVQGGDLCYFA